MTRRLRSEPDDDGIAIILVLCVAVIVSALLVTLAQYTVISIRHSRDEQDTQASLTAAQAGLDDYLYRINANNVYWQTTDCSNVANSGPRTGASPPCGYTASTPVGWAPVPGATTPGGQSCATVPLPVACASYHYDVDASATVSSGIVQLTSSGRSKGIVRTIRGTVRRQSFGDYLYFTDYETIDPANRTAYPTTAARTYAAANCSRHFWDVPARGSGCLDIQFAGVDTINGPAHSNDAILMSGSPTFKGRVTTGYPACQPSAAGVAPPASACYRDADGDLTTVPSFAKGISYGGDLPLPATNGQLQAQTLTATASGTAGCAFTGPTRIHFNSNGTMNVWSPFTVGPVNPGCGSATYVNGLMQTIPVPANNVIFVAPVPSSQLLPVSGPCLPLAIAAKYPQVGDENIAVGDWDCRSGLALVDGSLSGRVTLGAAGNILVVDDITYANGTSGSDSLGLVAAGAVQVYHPVLCTTRDLTTLDCTAGTNMPAIDNAGSPLNNLTVQAAVLALNHGFEVESYDLGSTLGTLNVYGSIAQLYRGVVARSSGSALTSGYVKSYVYDPRLQFAPPPYYLNPVQSKYVSAVFSEIPHAY